MHHVGVALDHHQVLHGHASGLTDPAEVIAAQINKHHVLSPFLGVGQQVSFQFAVFQGRGAAGPSSGNGAKAGVDAISSGFGLNHHLWTGANQLPVPKVEERHIWGRIHHPQTAVQLQGRLRHLGFQALTDHQLEHIAGCDVFLGGVDGGFEFIAAAVGAHRGKLFASRVPGEWFDGRQRCVHPLAQGLNPSDCGLPGLLLIRSVGKVAEGDSGDLSFHLIKDQDRVHQHPDPIRGIGSSAGMNGDGGFDPLDEFVTPNAIELPKRREARQVDAGVRRQAVAQGLEWIPVEGFFATISPGARQTIVAR